MEGGRWWRLRLLLWMCYRKGKRGPPLLGGGTFVSEMIELILEKRRHLYCQKKMGSMSAPSNSSLLFLFLPPPFPSSTVCVNDGGGGGRKNGKSTSFPSSFSPLQRALITVGGERRGRSYKKWEKRREGEHKQTNPKATQATSRPQPQPRLWRRRKRTTIEGYIFGGRGRKKGKGFPAAAHV